MMAERSGRAMEWPRAGARGRDGVPPRRGGARRAASGTVQRAKRAASTAGPTEGRGRTVAPARSGGGVV